MPGVCGLQTTVTVCAKSVRCTIGIDSECRYVQGLAATSRIWQLAGKHRLHAACPVPVGILKAIEVEAGLALPADVSIVLWRE